VILKPKGSVGGQGVDIGIFCKKISKNLGPSSFKIAWKQMAEKALKKMGKTFRGQACHSKGPPDVEGVSYNSTCHKDVMDTSMFNKLNQ